MWHGAYLTVSTTYFKSRYTFQRGCLNYSDFDTQFLVWQTKHGVLLHAFVLKLQKV